MILIDTSAWIEYFRATGSAAAVEVRRLLSVESDRVVICEPIAMEILAGAADDDRHAKLERLVNGLASLRVDDAVDYRSAGDLPDCASFRSDDPEPQRLPHRRSGNAPWRRHRSS